MAQSEPRFRRTLKNVLLGRSRDPRDVAVFHRLSLVAFFAWVGLGADPLSSSCYGPAEAFLTLGEHRFLGIFVGLGTVITIFIISASYSQIVELFPTGGGGYFVATKLLSPKVGMVSGCALLIDYVLTISVSIASGTDAILSFLPVAWHGYKLYLATLIVIMMILLNMRGVRESVIPLVPIFVIFLVAHAFVIVYGLLTHLPNMTHVIHSTQADVRGTLSTLGFWGLVFIVLRAYSMGAGTFTGLEAVSNGLPVLREPRVHTAQITMRYMAFSLAFVALGLMIAFLLYDIQPQAGKTLNAVLFEHVTAGWGERTGGLFVLIILLSEAMLLTIAAQSGFLDGPRVLANMALDRWFPTRFSVLSERLVIQNGILIMGISSLAIMLLTRGSVRLLVVLYSINVFITFTLSQLGMVRHWWLDRHRARGWFGKLLINGVGLVLTAFILLSMVVFKFFEGGWVTLLITGTLIVLAMLIRRHYNGVAQQLRRLDELAQRAELYIRQPGAPEAPGAGEKPAFNPRAKTAVLLVSGFNGTGLHTLLAIMRIFGDQFRNFVFLQIGQLDVGNFKGPQEIERLQASVQDSLDRYVQLMGREGFYAEGIGEIGVDVVDEVVRLVPAITAKYPGAVFFGGKLLFLKETVFDLLLHNQIVFSVQRRLQQQGIPFVILPLRV